MTVLLTDNLMLAPCTPGDRADFMALELDPQVMRFLNGGHAVDHQNPAPNAPFLMPRGTEPHVWTARRPMGGAFVGWFCLWPETDRVAKLGYRLRRADWGQGLASEGASALIDWGFATYGYDRIFAGTMAINHASRRVLTKIDMSFVRSYRLDETALFPGGNNDEVEYELLRSRWTGG